MRTMETGRLGRHELRGRKVSPSPHSLVAARSGRRCVVQPSSTRQVTITVTHSGFPGRHTQLTAGCPHTPRPPPPGTVDDKDIRSSSISSYVPLPSPLPFHTFLFHSSLFSSAIPLPFPPCIHLFKTFFFLHRFAFSPFIPFSSFPPLLSIPCQSESFHRHH